MNEVGSFEFLLDLMTGPDFTEPTTDTAYLGDMNYLRVRPAYFIKGLEFVVRECTISDEEIDEHFKILENTCPQWGVRAKALTPNPATDYYGLEYQSFVFQRGFQSEDDATVNMKIECIVRICTHGNCNLDTNC